MVPPLPTFTAAGSYVLQVTATSGAETASATVGVTVNLVPQIVKGLWNGMFAVPDGTPPAFSFDLDQENNDVGGTFAYGGVTVPTAGTFDCTRLDLTATYADLPVTFAATVKGDTMTGTISYPGTTTSFTATR